MGQEFQKLDRAGHAADDGADRTVIIGAGPAGLTAAWELTRNGRGALVLEQDTTHVGGIARTVSYKGFRFDIGGHRFFSKNADIEKLWSETLGDRLIERDRLSRIYYRGRFFKYPLETLNVLENPGRSGIRRLHGQLRRGAASAEARNQELRGLGGQRFWTPAL
jgi:protoporphyrinogen oxidase